jgi:hypothetical protein
VLQLASRESPKSTVSAIKEKGILSGKRIERAEVGTPGEFETMTDDDLSVR